jgi:tRNA dimethylallyltransferase
MHKTKQKIVIIVGPTASGKTALAVDIACTFQGEVISADSRQVYKGLEIGTGKVTKKEMKGVPHHLLDIVSPSRVFTADDFVKKGRKAIAAIVKAGKLPIVAGGTGFYIDALTGAMSLPNVPPNPLLRKKLEGLSKAELFAILEAKDPRRAADIDIHNPVRLIRALEIAEAIGASPLPSPSLLYDVLWIGIDAPKEVLDRKIETRLHARMERGMLKEAKNLHVAGLSWKRMEDLGLEYRYMARLLQKQITREEFNRDLTTEIKRYAKRQRMYWKRNKEIRWFTQEKLSGVEEVVRGFIYETSDSTIELQRPK